MRRGILDAIDMNSYRVEKKAVRKLALPDEDAEIDPVPAAGGGQRSEPETDHLSNILKVFNERFGDIDWQHADRVRQLVTETIPSRVAEDTAFSRSGRHRVQKREYRRTLNDALDRLPDHSARGLKRGATLTPNEIAGYVPGSVVTEAAFTSASVGRSFGGNVRFTIRSLHGKRIDRLSRYPSEREVLFRAGTRFRVLSSRREGGLTKIELEEVDDA